MCETCCTSLLSMYMSQCRLCFHATVMAFASVTLTNLKCQPLQITWTNRPILVLAKVCWYWPLFLRILDNFLCPSTRRLRCVDSPPGLCHFEPACAPVALTLGSKASACFFCCIMAVDDDGTELDAALEALMLEFEVAAELPVVLPSCDSQASWHCCLSKIKLHRCLPAAGGVSRLIGRPRSPLGCFHPAPAARFLL